MKLVIYWRFFIYRLILISNGRMNRVNTLKLSSRESSEERRSKKKSHLLMCACVFVCSTRLLLA